MSIPLSKPVTPEESTSFSFRERLSSIIRFSMCVRCGVSLRVPVCFDAYLLFSYRGRSRWPISDSGPYYTHGSAQLSIPFEPLRRQFLRSLSLKVVVGVYG